MSGSNLLERRYNVLGKNSPLFYERPVQLVSGEGVWLWDADGNKYLDGYNNVPHVGHCHPHVADALCNQARTLNTHTRYLDETIVRYGEKLTATFDGDLSRLHLCCSGTEANELALRIARTCTGNAGVIVSDFAYHGNSKTIAEISSAFPGPEGVGKDVRVVTVPNLYRLRPGVTEADAAAAYAADVAAAIESLAADGLKPAALLVDTIFSCEGLPDVPAGYLEQAVALVREAGGLYIADEVQPGFGRTGTGMWGYQQYDVTPDIVTMGKPMGNGHPLAGVVVRPDLLDAFGQQAMYFNTFGGNPVSCAVGIAVLEVIERENLMENARVVGDYARDGLRELANKHDIIGDVRGPGFFFGADMVRDRATREPATEETGAIVNGMRERGVLISRTGYADNVLKIRPPMPFSKENADHLLSALDDTLSAL